MSLGGELLVGAVILFGLLGIVFPILPGTLLVAGAIGVWAAMVGGWAWGVFAVAAVIIVIGEVGKYFIAGRSLRANGIPNLTIGVGGVVGIIGFFVVPVIGLFLGFIVGAMAAELVRTRTLTQAWWGTRAAARAAVTTIGIELLAALLATGVWLVGAGVW